MAKPSPSISIIIRAKNEELWIATCLKKIRQQTLKNIEVVLVDSGSSDKTIPRAIAEFPDLKIIKITADGKEERLKNA